MSETTPGSQAHALLLERTRRWGYPSFETTLCPTELGVPMRRPRYYWTSALKPRPREASTQLIPLGDRVPSLLSEDFEPELLVPQAILDRHGPGFRILDATQTHVATTCFTSAYGRTWMHSGSYWRTPKRQIRRFSPQEILALLGFSSATRLPPELPLKKQWDLVGNSLSVDAVRWLLAD